MTQKEKAKQIVEKYETLNYEWDGATSKGWAKEGALIAVDFALSQLEVKISPPRLDIQIQLNEQNLNKLKQEIEKL
jgi:hypothetical protein